MPDHLDDLRTFAAVVREGSFTAAARALGHSKQRVSLRVAALEAELGVRLLERTTRRLRPTDAGARYAERCQAIVAAIADADADARAAQTTVTGHLRVSAPKLFGRRVLADPIAAYVAEHPSVRVSVELTDRRVDLIAEGFDAAVRVGPLEDASLTARRLGEAGVAYVAAPSWLACHGPVDGARLGDVDTIALRDDEAWATPAGDVRVRARLVVNDLDAVLAAAVAGVGVARLPRLACRDLLDAGRLVTVLPDPPPAPVHLLLPSRAHRPPRVRRFVEVVVAASAALV